MRNPGFEKRQKELKRLEKQRDKAAKRLERKVEKAREATGSVLDEDNVGSPVAPPTENGASATEPPPVSP